MPPSSTWTIEEVPQGDGSVDYDVSLGNRRQRTYSDLDRALRHIKDRYITGQKVVRIEADGYRVLITQQFLSLSKARKGW